MVKFEDIPRPKGVAPHIESASRLPSVGGYEGELNAGCGVKDIPLATRAARNALRQVVCGGGRWLFFEKSVRICNLTIVILQND